MHELLNSRSVKSTTFFLIDFEDREIGSKGITVKSDDTWNFVRATQGTPTDGVVDHPTFGKVYRLDGNVTFREPTKRLHLLTRPNFRLDMEFVTERDYCQMFETGADSSRMDGWNMWTTSQVGTWCRAYIRRNATGYNPVVGSGSTPLNKLNHISVVKDGTSLIMKDENAGVSTNINITNFQTPDSYFSLMCGYSGFGGATLGYLKRWEVRLSGY